MIQFRHYLNGKIPSFDLLRPTTLDDFSEIEVIRHAPEDVEFDDTLFLSVPITPDCESR